MRRHIVMTFVQYYLELSCFPHILTLRRKSPLQTQCRFTISIGLSSVRAIVFSEIRLIFFSRHCLRSVDTSDAIELVYSRRQFKKREA